MDGRLKNTRPKLGAIASPDSRPFGSADDVVGGDGLWCVRTLCYHFCSRLKFGHSMIDSSNPVFIIVGLVEVIDSRRISGGSTLWSHCSTSHWYIALAGLSRFADVVLSRGYRRQHKIEVWTTTTIHNGRHAHLLFIDAFARFYTKFHNYILDCAFEHARSSRKHN